METSYKLGDVDLTKGGAIRKWDLSMHSRTGKTEMAYLGGTHIVRRKILSFH